jgi:hypothetical protein
MNRHKIQWIETSATFSHPRTSDTWNWSIEAREITWSSEGMFNINKVGFRSIISPFRKKANAEMKEGLPIHGFFKLAGLWLDGESRESVGASQAVEIVSRIQHKSLCGPVTTWTTFMSKSPVNSSRSNLAWAEQWTPYVRKQWHRPVHRFRHRLQWTDRWSQIDTGSEPIASDQQNVEATIRKYKCLHCRFMNDHLSAIAIGCASFLGRKLLIPGMDRRLQRSPPRSREHDHILRIFQSTSKFALLPNWESGRLLSDAAFEKFINGIWFYAELLMRCANNNAGPMRQPRAELRAVRPKSNRLEISKPNEENLMKPCKKMNSKFLLNSSYGALKIWSKSPGARLDVFWGYRQFQWTQIIYWGTFDRPFNRIVIAAAYLIPQIENQKVSCWSNCSVLNLTARSGDIPNPTKLFDLRDSRPADPQGGLEDNGSRGPQGR